MVTCSARGSAAQAAVATTSMKNGRHDTNRRFMRSSNQAELYLQQCLREIPAAPVWPFRPAIRTKNSAERTSVDPLVVGRKEKFDPGSRTRAAATRSSDELLGIR